MVKSLYESHETVCRTARKVMPKTDEVHDEATADMVTERLRFHEKTSWMLRSLVNDNEN